MKSLFSVNGCAIKLLIISFSKLLLFMKKYKPINPKAKLRPITNISNGQRGFIGVELVSFGGLCLFIGKCSAFMIIVLLDRDGDCLINIRKRQIQFLV